MIFKGDTCRRHNLYRTLISILKTNYWSVWPKCYLLKCYLIILCKFWCRCRKLRHVIEMNGQRPRKRSRDIEICKISSHDRPILYLFYQESLYKRGRNVYLYVVPQTYLLSYCIHLTRFSCFDRTLLQF